MAAKCLNIVKNAALYSSRSEGNGDILCNVILYSLEVEATTAYGRAYKGWDTYIIRE